MAGRRTTKPKVNDSQPKPFSPEFNEQVLNTTKKEETKMAGFALPWDEIKDGVDDGEYTVVFEKASHKVNPEKNTENVTIQVAVQDDNKPEFNGTKLFPSFQVVNKDGVNRQAIGFMRRAFIAFGADPEFFASGKNNEYNGDVIAMANDTLVGRTAIGVAATNTNNGREFQQTRIRAED